MKERYEWVLKLVRVPREYSNEPPTEGEAGHEHGDAAETNVVQAAAQTIRPRGRNTSLVVVTVRLPGWVDLKSFGWFWLTFTSSRGGRLLGWSSRVRTTKLRVQIEVLLTFC